MTGLDDHLDAARPTAGPDESVVARHRQALTSAIDAEAASSSGERSASTHQLELAPRTGTESGRGARRHHRWAPAAACLLVAVTVVGAITFSRRNEAGPTDVTAALQDPPPSPTCRGALPLTVELRPDAGQVTDEGVGPGGERSWYHATADGYEVDVVWPAPPQALYGTDASLPRGIETISGGGPTGGELSFENLPRDRQGVVGRTVGVQPVDDVSPAPGCEVVALTVVEPGRAPLRFGWDTTAGSRQELSALVDIRPLVIRSTPADVAPVLEGRCSSRVVDARGAITPRGSAAEALAAFVAEERPDLGRAGFVEIVLPGGVYVYGAPFQDLQGNPDETRFARALTVEAVAGGWSVTSWRSGVCL